MILPEAFKRRHGACEREPAIFQLVNTCSQCVTWPCCLLPWPNYSRANGCLTGTLPADKTSSCDSPIITKCGTQTSSSDPCLLDGEPRVVTPPWAYAASVMACGSDTHAYPGGSSTHYRKRHPSQARGGEGGWGVHVEVIIETTALPADLW